MRISFDGETWMGVSPRRVESLAALPDVDCHLDVAGEGEPPCLTTLARHRLGLPPYGMPTGQTLCGFPIVFVRVRNDYTVNLPPGVSPFVTLEPEIRNGKTVRG